MLQPVDNNISIVDKSVPMEDVNLPLVCCGSETWKTNNTRVLDESLVLFALKRAYEIQDPTVILAVNVLTDGITSQLFSLITEVDKISNDLERYENIKAEIDRNNIEKSNTFSDMDDLCTNQIIVLSIQKVSQSIRIITESEKLSTLIRDKLSNFRTCQIGEVCPVGKEIQRSRREDEKNYSSKKSKIIRWDFSIYNTSPLIDDSFLRTYDLMISRLTYTAFSYTKEILEACNSCRKPFQINDKVYLKPVEIYPIFFGGFIGGCKVRMNSQDDCCQLCIDKSIQWVSENIISRPTSLIAALVELYQQLFVPNDDDNLKVLMDFYRISFQIKICEVLGSENIITVKEIKKSSEAIRESIFSKYSLNLNPDKHPSRTVERFFKGSREIIYIKSSSIGRSIKEENNEDGHFSYNGPTFLPSIKRYLPPEIKDTSILINGVSTNTILTVFKSLLNDCMQLGVIFRKRYNTGGIDEKITIIFGHHMDLILSVDEFMKDSTLNLFLKQLEKVILVQNRNRNIFPGLHNLIRTLVSLTTGARKQSPLPGDFRNGDMINSGGKNLKNISFFFHFYVYI